MLPSLDHKAFELQPTRPVAEIESDDSTDVQTSEQQVEGRGGRDGTTYSLTRGHAGTKATTAPANTPNIRNTSVSRQ